MSNNKLWPKGTIGAKVLEHSEKRHSGTSDGMDMLELLHDPSHYVAGNLYITALGIISQLRAQAPAVARFLEAAGRVDKELAIQWFHQARSDFYEPVVREAIRRMFDALPDKPDAEEKRVEDEAYLRNMDEPGPKEEKL